MCESPTLYRGFVPPPRTEEIAQDVFATIHPDGSWGLSNAGFVKGADGVAVVDSLLTEGRTRNFIEEIRRRAGQTPVRYLINTHYHCDHTYGNQLFDGATIIGHPDCRDRMVATGLAPTRRDPFVPWGDIRICPPTLTFEGRLKLFVGDTELELIQVGPAHTTHDVIVWLPRSRVLFTGDVLFTDATPILTDGSLTGSLAALDLMTSLDPDVIVPGHGELTDLSQVRAWRSYFDFLGGVATRAAAAGEHPLDVARDLDLGGFARWQHPDRIVLNLHRAIAEAAGAAPGAPLDGEQIFGDMLRHNPHAYGHKLIDGSESYVDRPRLQEA